MKKKSFLFKLICVFMVLILLTFTATVDTINFTGKNSLFVNVVQADPPEDTGSTPFSSNAEMIQAMLNFCQATANAKANGTLSYSYSYDNSKRQPTVRNLASIDGDITQYTSHFGTAYYDCYYWVNIALIFGAGLPRADTIVAGGFPGPVVTASGMQGDYWHLSNSSMFNIQNGDVHDGDLYLMNCHVGIIYKADQTNWRNSILSDQGSSGTLSQRLGDQANQSSSTYDGDCIAANGHKGHEVAWIATFNDDAYLHVRHPFTGGSGAFDLFDANLTVDLDSREFKFSGLPKTISYEGYTHPLTNLFKNLGRLLDLLTALLVNTFKRALIGWGRIFEMSVNNVFYKIEQGYDT